MKMFYVCADRGVPPDGTRGASVHFRSLAATLQEAGHDVTALMRAAPRNGVPFPTPLLPFSDGDSLVAAADTAGQPDLVCERYAFGATEGLQASRRLGVPFALEVTTPLVSEATRRPGTVETTDTEVEGRLFREADLVFAISEPLRRYVAGIRGSDAGTAVLRNGCDPRRFLARWGRTADGARVLAFLGHPKPRYGTEQLVPLLADLLADGYDVRLLVIGGGAGAAELEQQALRRGVRGRLEVTGAVDPSVVATLLARATLGLAPYAEDPFFYSSPLKVIECMAAGLPVVTAAQGDLPEIVGDAGVLVPPGQPRALGAAVRALLDDPLHCRALGDRARARVVEHYTWPKTAQRLMELAAPLVESRPRAR